MLTTFYLRQSFARINEKLDYSIYKEQEKEQKKIEDEIVGSFQPCFSNSTSVNPFPLEEMKLGKLKNKEYYNSNLMDFISCATDVIFNAPKYKAGILSDISFIKTFINNVQQIGAESVNGYAMRASLKKSEDFYILKSARNLAQDELTHELSVGLLGTNKLRRFCPNFAYIYGGFKCSPPIIEDKEVKAFCSTKDRNGLQYVVYENIDKAISMGEYCRSCSPQQFLQVYLQVLYALNKAVDVCDFTHYDLHSDNVLIRPLPKGDKAYLTCYTEKGQVEYMEVENVATIIDFGNSHITFEGKHLGTYGLQSFSTLPDVSFPMYDAYKLLMFCASEMEQNPNTLDVARYIFKFFNTQEDITQALKEQRDLYYSLPYTVDTYKLKLLDLTAYIRKIYDCSFITSQSSPGLPSLVCQNNCLTIEEIKETTTSPSPSTLWEVYDLSYTKPYDCKKDYDRLITSFEDEAEATVDKVNKTLDILDKVNISLSPNSQPLIKEERVISFVNNTFILSDLLNHLKIMIAVQYSFNEENDYFEQVASFVLNTDKMLDKYKEVIKNNENTKTFAVVKDKVKFL